MLTYRTGAAGTPSVAMAMVAHLSEQTLPVPQANLAAYYRHGSSPAVNEPSAFAITKPEVRPDLDPRLGALLGLSPEQVLTQKEIGPIAGKQVQRITKSLADELGLSVDRMPSSTEVRRILAGQRADTGEALPENRMGALRSRFLRLFGYDDERGSRRPTPIVLRNILDGKRADGESIQRTHLLDSLSATRARIGYIDLCWSSDKSVSLAWALAPTEAERALIAAAHKEAVASTMRYFEAEIGRARKGKAGRAGYDAGKLAWISFDHYTARPTTEIVRDDPATGEPYTELITLKVAGTPQIHTHVIVPAAILTDDSQVSSDGKIILNGRVVSMDLRALKGRVHELGHLYHAFLATKLRRSGVDVVLDPKSGAARLAAIPPIVRAAFSKRTKNGTEAARAYARECGLDWDSLNDSRKIGLIKRGTQGNPRQAKRDDLGDWDAWRRQALNLGWVPRSVLHLGAPSPPMDRAARLQRAYEAALNVLENVLQRRAVVDEAEARAAAACGLITAGIEGAGDIDAVMQLFNTRGVRHAGKMTQLIWGQRIDEQGNVRARLTTKLQAEREEELISLVKAAAADCSGALSSAELDAAIARSKLDYHATEHGRTQINVMRRLGQGGRFSVAFGVAGAGKTSLIGPLVSGWNSHGRSGSATNEGRLVYGAALAWRQSDDLTGAGIHEDRCLALSVLLNRVRNKKLLLKKSDVVVLDELSLVGVESLLDLCRLQSAYGFSIVAICDPNQCQSIDAGPTIEILRRALGAEAIPEILTTIRQHSERERATTLLFREGRAAEALDAKREDASARLVAGDYDHVVKTIADLWQERREANVNDPNYTLSVSAPTNSDARAIAAAIRHHRRAKGEIGADQVLVSACDQTGDAFELPLAVGDRVRLFNRVNASYADKSRGLLGNNGSVLEVLSIAKAGVTLRNGRGRIGLVAWDTLRDPEGGRIRLTYGDVLTIDASQGITNTEHIEAMPAGTSGVNAYKAYTASSRHRRTTYIICSDGAERREIATRRPLGDTRRITDRDVWENIARNLSRQPVQESALAFMEHAHQVRENARTAFQISMQRIEQRTTANEMPSTLTHRWRRRRRLGRVLQLAKDFNAWIRGRETVIASLNRLAKYTRTEPRVLKRTIGLSYRM